MFVTLMEPGPKPGSIVLLGCSQVVTGATEIRNLDVEALRLMKFDIDGKVFAYGVSGGWLGGEDPSGGRTHIGTLSDIFFYDLDGSGKFTLMKYTETLSVPEVPAWVKKKSAAK